VNTKYPFPPWVLVIQQPKVSRDRYSIEVSCIKTLLNFIELQFPRTIPISIQFYSWDPLQSHTHSTQFLIAAELERKLFSRSYSIWKPLSSTYKFWKLVSFLIAELSSAKSILLLCLFPSSITHKTSDPPNMSPLTLFYSFNLRMKINLRKTDMGISKDQQAFEGPILHSNFQPFQMHLPFSILICYRHFCCSWNLISVVGLWL